MGWTDVGDVRTPDLVRARDGHATQQMRINRVLGMGRAGVLPRHHAGQAERAHQSLHPLAVDRKAQRPQRDHHAPAPVAGPTGVLGIDQTQQLQVSFIADRTWRAHRHSRVGDTGQGALAPHRQSGRFSTSRRIDPVPKCAQGVNPDFFSASPVPPSTARFRCRADPHPGCPRPSCAHASSRTASRPAR